MTKVLVIQGAGMNMRGKVQVETFGPNTLDQINEQIPRLRRKLGHRRENRPLQRGGRGDQRPV